MKFTKEEAVEKLSQILTNGGKKTLRMSQRTLDENTKSLMSLIATEEMELDDFVEKVKPQFESINSNIEKDHSDFVKNYEKEHPVVPPKVESTPDKPTDDPAMKALLERLEAMEKANKEREDRDSVKEKISGIRSYLKNNNVTDEEWINKTLELFPVNAEDNVEDRGKAILQYFTDTHKGGPRVPSAGGPGDESEVDFGDVAALIKQREDVK